MRITFAVDGGFAVFPGLARPVTIDVAAGGDGEDLRALVERARFFDRAEPSTATLRGAADRRCHVVTVSDGARQRTLRLPEPTDDADLAALVAALVDRVRRPRSR